MLVAVALTGLFIGLALGALGAGGSILAVPALVHLAGQPLAAAIPTSLIVVGVSAAAALAPRLRGGGVRWPVALVFGAAGVPAAFGGAALGRTLSPRLLMLGFALLMAVVAVRMLRERTRSGGACRTRGGGVEWRTCLPSALGTGAVVGVLTGLFGVGGGFLIVPALTLLLGLGAAEAVATSLVVIVINSAPGWPPTPEPHSTGPRRRSSRSRPRSPPPRPVASPVACRGVSSAAGSPPSCCSWPPGWASPPRSPPAPCPPPERACRDGTNSDSVTRSHRAR